MKLGTIYTLSEVALALGMKPNPLRRLARRQGLCGTYQQHILFDECDIECLREVLEKAATRGCRPSEVDYLAETAIEHLSEMMREEKERKRKARETRRNCT